MYEVAQEILSRWAGTLLSRRMLHACFQCPDATQTPFSEVVCPRVPRLSLWAVAERYADAPTVASVPPLCANLFSRGDETGLQFGLRHYADIDKTVADQEIWPTVVRAVKMEDLVYGAIIEETRRLSMIELQRCSGEDFGRL